MNWGWYDKFQQVIKEQADFAEKQEEERKQKQEESWKAFVKYFSETRLCRFMIDKFKWDTWIDWVAEKQDAVAVFVLIVGASLFFIIPVMGSAASLPGSDSVGVRMLKLLAAAIIVMMPFALGKRRLLKGNVTAMKLVRMDHNGHPIGREASMTRQDIDQVRAFFRGTARLFHVGGFELGTYRILVDKDYKRKFTIYFNNTDDSVFRASRHFWNWRLSESETKSFYEFLQKYVDRLGESEEMNHMIEIEKQDT